MYDSARHLQLETAPWDPAAVRTAIAEILNDAAAALDPESFWPAHPLDEGVPDGSTTLYAGAAGVFWALHHLRHAADVCPDLWPLIPRLIEASRREYAARSPYPRHASLLMGEVGALLVALRLEPAAALADRLYRRIEDNLELVPLELMWGLPGTMLAARFAQELTGEPRWRAVFRRQAERLLAELQDTAFGPLWVQELYGSHGAYLGPVHGFAGHMLPFLRSWDWLEAVERECVEAAVGRTLAANAHESADGVNWHALAGAQGAPYLVQYCHGAPGIVTTFADSPFSSPGFERLLARAGELVWRAGPLRKGGGLCHGTAGNGYAFLKLHRRLGDAVWLERARAFAMTAIAQWRAARRHYGRSRYSLWTGDPGLAVYLGDCLRAEARFPTIDVL
jgi:hypothetical protein